MYSSVLHSLPSLALIAAQLVSLQVLTPPDVAGTVVGVTVPRDPELVAETVGLTIKLVVVSFAALVVKLHGAPSLLNSLSVPRT